MNKILIIVIIGGRHMPRALTVQEKKLQRKRLLDKGKEIALSIGIRKISIDDITKAAGMAKGTFYKHFDSKEKFIYEVIMEFYQQIFIKSEQLIKQETDLPSNMHTLLINVFHLPEIIFLIKNYREIIELNDTLSPYEIELTNQVEIDIYDQLLKKAGADTTIVSPEVVHNYFHMLYMVKGSEIMIKEYVTKTFELIIDSLATYILGGML